MTPINPETIAGWLVREIRAWPPAIDASQLAQAIGVQAQHVRAARSPRAAVREFRLTDKQIGAWPPRGQFNWERRLTTTNRRERHQ